MPATTASYQTADQTCWRYVFSFGHIPTFSADVNGYENSVIPFRHNHPLNWLREATFSHFGHW